MTGHSTCGANRRRSIAVLMIAMMVATGFLISCGGGGSDGTTSTGTATVSALTMPDRISITSVDDSGASAQSFSDTTKSLRSYSVRTAAVSRAFSDPGTDYANQEKDVWVEDTEALDMVNDILGVVQDTGYKNFVNAGAYKALVKKVGDSEQSAGGTSTTSTTTEELMEITVDVTRESNTAPMIVKVWVLEEDGPGDTAMLIRGYFSVTEGVSASYPYGQMEAHFVGVALDEAGAETANEVMTMAIKVDADDDGNVVVQCVDAGDEEEGSESFAWDNRFRLVTNSDLSEGQAYVNVYESWSNGTDSDVDAYEGYIAYDADYFKEMDADTGDIAVYDKNALHRKVYRYKLFDAETGDKTTLNGGFPITLESGAYGYIGYYGLWANDGIVVGSGDQVTDMDGNAYTVFNVGGKLRKHTRTQVTLGELTGVEMSMWIDDDTGGTDWIIAWNGSEFDRIGLRNQMGQVEYGDYEPVVFENEWDGAWCEALNAHLSLGRLYAEGTPTDATVVSFHAEETVNPASAQNWTFYYWGPVVGETQGEYWAANPTASTILGFDAANMVLRDSGGEELVETTGQEGYWMSPLTTTAYTQENQWQAHDADVYYSWSTGPNQWDQFTALKDAGNQFVSFDAPLHFNYVHSQANDLNNDPTHDGRTFAMDYDGYELQVPWNYNSELDEWQPIFSLKDGTILTDGNGGTYVVKGIEVGVVMSLAGNPADAAAVVIDETIEAPTLQYDASMTDLVGDRPAAVLKVIKGEAI